MFSKLFCYYISKLALLPEVWHSHLGCFFRLIYNVCDQWMCCFWGVVIFRESSVLTSSAYSQLKSWGEVRAAHGNGMGHGRKVKAKPFGWALIYINLHVNGTRENVANKLFNGDFCRETFRTLPNGEKFH